MASITNARQLGATVRAVRKQRGLSQQALAGEADVSRTWLARFETGHHAASIDPIFRVLRALGLSLDISERRTSDAESALLAALAERGEH